MSDINLRISDETIKKALNSAAKEVLRLHNKNYLLFISPEDARLIEVALALVDDNAETFDKTYSDCLKRFQKQIDKSLKHVKNEE